MGRTTVGDVIVDGLTRAGVARVFTVSGLDSILLAAFHRQGIDAIVAAEAPAACIMAAATAELTETPGVALVPGGTEAVADVARAFVDRAPLIVLTTGDASRAATALAPVVKARLVAQAASAAHWVAHALQLAMKHPRGPVHLDIPIAADVAALPVATTVRPQRLPPPDEHALDVATDLLGSASRPVIVTGAHCRSQQDASWLRPFAETLPAPVVTTPKAKGVLPDPHPLALGLLGSAGASSVLAKADLIVAVGVDPAELNEWMPATRALHLGPTAPEGPLATATAHVLGDIGPILEDLAPRLRAIHAGDWDVAELDRLKRRTRGQPSGNALTPARVARIVRGMTVAGTIAVVDGGEDMRQVADAWQAVAPREFLASNSVDAVGFAVPAAVAAGLAHPERRVVAFMTETGMNAARRELASVVRLGARVLLVVLTAGPLSEARAPDGLESVSCDSEAAVRAELNAMLALDRPGRLCVRVHSEKATV